MSDGADPALPGAASEAPEAVAELETALALSLALATEPDASAVLPLVPAQAVQSVAERIPAMMMALTFLLFIELPPSPSKAIGRFSP